MADFWEKLWHGLRGELLRTILLAVTVSILLYTGLQPVSRVVLQSFYTNSDFLQTKTDAVGTLIQQNVAESGISSRQVRRITDWYSRGDQPGGCILRVEKDGVVIYDSALNNVEYYRTYSQASKTLDESAYLRTYPLEFSDGSATLYAYGYFDFAVDEAVRTAEFWLCLVLGIGIVLWAVWKKLNYMETLEQSIRVLEGGQLDYKVPVRGTDELAQMAQSLNEMSASLKQQMEQVQQAQQQRYELVTSLSHDLRTPLTSIYGACSTVIENYDSLDKEQKVKLLGEACSDAQWLNRMVENLLSVTRFDNDKVAVQKTPTVLEELIDTVLVRFQKRYPDVNVKLELPDSFIVIPMDSMLISQVLTNLLENAVLHAEGMTQLTLKVFTVGSHAVFEVTDNGCGIPKERLKKLFSGMLPAEDTADHGKHSMGIGLSVCAAIVKAHGGEIKAESRQGEGTTIRFWLETESIETEENQDEQ